MCGRFSLTQRLDVLERLFKAKARANLILPRYNIAPTQPLAAICKDDPDGIVEVDWGFTLVPTNGDPPRLLVNAQAETLEQRPTFAEPFRNKRCLVLADGFYEWHDNGGKRYPRYFRLRGGAPFAFAGLYDEEGGMRHAVIITTDANELVAPVHSRMPVVLADPAMWLRDDDAERLKMALLPFEAAAMESFSVNPIVNSPEVDSPQCIEPFEPPQLPLF